MEPKLERYSRQILFSSVGEEGQKKLLDSYIVIIGCGALGSIQANLLARAGVGRLLLVDRDFTEENNLQRQVLFNEEDVLLSTPKVIAAQKKLKAINSTIKVDSLITDVTDKNIKQIIKGADLVLDGLDNFKTRFLINDACLEQNIPWIYGGCVGSQGLSMTILPGVSPCLRCVFESAPPPELSPSCNTARILSTAVNMIASIQVTEAIKLLIGDKAKLHEGLVSLDAWDNTFKVLNFSKYGEDEKCELCRTQKKEVLKTDEKDSIVATSLCGRNAVQVMRPDKRELQFDALAEKLKSLCEVSHNDYIFYFAVEDYEVSVFKDGRAIIKGTEDLAVAKNIYSQYVGN